MNNTVKRKIANVLWSTKVKIEEAYGHYKPYQPDLDHGKALTEIGEAMKLLEAVKDEITEKSGGGMRELGDRNYLLLSDGAKTTGSYVEGYHYVEERLYAHEAETIYKFCQWCDEDKANRSWGSGNYESRFKQFLEETK